MPSGTITHEFTPGDKVWVIYSQASDALVTNLSRSGCSPLMDGSGVVEGKVTYYRVDVLLTETKEWYGVTIKGSTSTRDFNIADIFPSLTHALVEYENRLSTGVGEASTRVRQFVYESEVPAEIHAVVHNFGFQDVIVQVYGKNGEKVNPLSIVLQDQNTAIIDFGMPYECKVVVVGKVNYS